MQGTRGCERDGRLRHSSYPQPPMHTLDTSIKEDISFSFYEYLRVLSGAFQTFLGPPVVILERNFSLFLGGASRLPQVPSQALWHHTGRVFLSFFFLFLLFFLFESYAHPSGSSGGSYGPPWGPPWGPLWRPLGALLFSFFPLGIGSCSTPVKYGGEDFRRGVVEFFVKYDSYDIF
jgi:hypothetical protein